MHVHNVKEYIKCQQILTLVNGNKNSISYSLDTKSGRILSHSCSLRSFNNHGRQHYVKQTKAWLRFIKSSNVYIELFWYYNVIWGASPLSPPPIQAISSRIPSQEDFWYKSIANFKVNPKPAVNPIPSQDLPDVTYLAVTPQSTQ